MVVLLYFDTMSFKVLTHFCKCKCANKQEQANKHCSEKLSPGFAFTLSLCQSTTTQPMCGLESRHTFQVIVNKIII